MSQRNIKRVPIDLPLLVDLCKTGEEVNVKITEGVPKDAVFVGSTFDAGTLTAYLIFCHPLFDEVKPHEIVPDQKVTIKKIEKKEPVVTKNTITNATPTGIKVNEDSLG